MLMLIELTLLPDGVRGRNVLLGEEDQDETNGDSLALVGSINF